MSPAKTLVYKKYKEFLSREEKQFNGVSESFARKHHGYEKENVTNNSCWNCSNCVDCVDCANCVDCVDCYKANNSFDCTRCAECMRCSDCSDCFGMFDCGSFSNKLKSVAEKFSIVPILKQIHKQVQTAISYKKEENIIDMSEWHACDTIRCQAHCRGGWVVFLAGEEGRELEEQTSPCFAAMQIYDKSSSIKVPPSRFFDTDEQAIEDIKRCAELETGENYV